MLSVSNAVFMTCTLVLLRDKPDLVRKFLAAASRGFVFAAEQPEAAAQVFLQAVQEEHRALPLPEPLNPKMVAASHAYTAKHLLNSSGKWGHQVRGALGAPPAAQPGNLHEHESC